jgi:hypothetical protein
VGKEVGYTKKIENKVRREKERRKRGMEHQN